NPNYVVGIHTEQTACIAFIDGNFQVIADAEQAKFLTLGNFIIMPAQLCDGFVPTKVQDKRAVILDFSKQFFMDVSDHVLKRINVYNASTDRILFNDRLENTPLHQLDSWFTYFTQFAATCQMASCLRKDIGKRKMKIFQVLNNGKFDDLFREIIKN